MIDHGLGARPGSFLSSSRPRNVRTSCGRGAIAGAAVAKPTASKKKLMEVVVNALAEGNSPWQKAQIDVIDKSYIKGFKNYATAVKKVSVFDLMCWSICCGAVDLTHLLWKRCNQPLRVALVAQQFAKRIRKKPARSHECM